MAAKPAAPPRSEHTMTISLLEEQHRTGLGYVDISKKCAVILPERKSWIGKITQWRKSITVR